MSFIDTIDRVDIRDEQTKKGDLLLTEDELMAYFVKHEAGKDGVLSADVECRSRA